MKRRTPEHVSGFDPDWKSALSRVLRESGKTVVLGVGNPRRGDDGAGPLCAARLHKSLAPAEGKRLLVIDGGAVPENHTGKIRRFSPDLTIVIDAAVAGRPPGTIFALDKDALADEGVSTHALSLRYLIRYLEESIGTRVLFLGIEPADRREGAPLSAPVSRAVEELTAALEGALSRPASRRIRRR